MTTSAARPTVSPGQLARQLLAGTTTVLDVRSPGEFTAGAIHGSRHLPLDQIADHAEQAAAGLPGPVTLVCRSGQRAGQAYDRLSAAGATHLTVLEGGLLGWQAAGQPVRAAAPGTGGPWDLERQVRLVAGSLVLAGGLVVAAVSNTCTMGRVLLTLPYNRRAVPQAGSAVAAVS